MNLLLFGLRKYFESIMHVHGITILNLQTIIVCTIMNLLLIYSIFSQLGLLIEFLSKSKWYHRQVHFLVLTPPC